MQDIENQQLKTGDKGNTNSPNAHSQSSDRQAQPQSEDDLVLIRAAEAARQNAARHMQSSSPINVEAVRPGRPAASDIAGREQREESRRNAARLEKLRTASRIPEKYARADLNNVSSLPAEVQTCYASTAQRLRQILKVPALFAIVGNRGPGKTHLGCALINEFIAAGRSGIYLDATDYLMELKRTYGPHAKRDELQVEMDYVRPDLLVLDEIQERGETPWEDRMLTRIANKRYAQNKATLLIANLTPEAFHTRVGESICDRIYEDGAIIECNWTSLRGRIKRPT